MVRLRERRARRSQGADPSNRNVPRVEVGIQRAVRVRVQASPRPARTHGNSTQDYFRRDSRDIRTSATLRANIARIRVLVCIFESVSYNSCYQVCVRKKPLLLQICTDVGTCVDGVVGTLVYAPFSSSREEYWAGEDLTLAIGGGRVMGTGG